MPLLTIIKVRKVRKKMTIQGTNGIDLMLLSLFFYISYRLIKRAIREDNQERINNIKVYDYRKVNNNE